MTAIERSISGASSQRSSERSTPIDHRQLTPTGFNVNEAKTQQLGAAVISYYISSIYTDDKYG